MSADPPHTVRLSASLARSPEHLRLVDALQAELQAFGALPERPIWSMSGGHRVRLTAEGSGWLLDAEAGDPQGWWPPIAVDPGPTAAVVASLEVRLGCAAHWWRSHPLSGALCKPDHPDEHAPLGDIAHEARRAGAPVWRRTDGRAEAAFPWRQDDESGVLHAIFPTNPPPEVWEHLRRGAEWLGAAERARAERARLDRDRRYLGALLNLVHDGLIAGAEDGEVVLYTPRMQQMVGWRHEEINHGAWMHRVYPDPSYRARMIAHIRSHFADTQFEDHSVELASRSGHTVLCDLRTAQSFDEHGRVVAFGAFRDSTALREAAGRQQQQANINAMGHIAATIAHDFRNMLGLVSGHAAVIEDQATGEVAARASRIRIAAERGEALARRMLSFGSARPVALRPVDLHAELLRAAELFSGPRGAPTVIAPEGPMWVRADINLLHDVLDNLIINGIAAQGGEVTGLRLTLDAAAQPSAPSFAAGEFSGEVMHLRVQDAGPGFSAEARAHLFQPFFTTRKGGHGLGLASVRQLVGMMLGAIDVPHLDENGPSGGIVDLYLPASATPGAEPTPTPVTAPPGTERVWALDDEPDIGDIVAYMLGELGYEVRTFAEPDALLRAVERDPNPPDLIMLDLYIGAHSGLQVLAELRARGRRQPVLLCTGGIPPALNDPRARVLEKPFNQLQLATAVRGLIDSMVFGAEPGRRRRGQT